MEHFIWLNWTSCYWHPCLQCSHFHSWSFTWYVFCIAQDFTELLSLLSTLSRECSTYRFSKLHSLVTTVIFSSKPFSSFSCCANYCLKLCQAAAYVRHSCVSSQVSGVSYRPIYSLVLCQAFSFQVCPPWCSVMLSGWSVKGKYVSYWPFMPLGPRFSQSHAAKNHLGLFTTLIFRAVAARWT